jgi:hypothetical protein
MGVKQGIAKNSFCVCYSFVHSFKTVHVSMHATIHMYLLFAFHVSGLCTYTLCP